MRDLFVGCFVIILFSFLCYAAILFVASVACVINDGKSRLGSVICYPDTFTYIIAISGILLIIYMIGRAINNEIEVGAGDGK